MRAIITTTISAPLCIKQLAGELGVSLSFVYKMRSAGFSMEWHAEHRCEVTTAAAAKAWMKQTGFRIVRGRGVLKGYKRGS